MTGLRCPAATDCVNLPATVDARPSGRFDGPFLEPSSRLVVSRRSAVAQAMQAVAPLESRRLEVVPAG